MPELPSKISSRNFKKIIAGAKGFVSSDQSAALRKAGMGSLLSKKNVSHQEALKAIKQLQAAGKVVKTSPAQMWGHAAIKQKKEDQATYKETAGRHIRAAIGEDLAEQLQKEEEELKAKIIGTDEKKYFGKLSDKFEESRIKREKKIASQLDTLEQLNSSVAPKKPPIQPTKDEPIDIFLGTD